MIFRVFVTRHYICSDFYDVEAESEKDAERLAKQAACKLRPDVRDVATDNGWQNDRALEIKELGYSRVGMEVVQVFETKKGKVFHHV